MAKDKHVNPSPVSPDLLEILRDPQAIQEGAVHGTDPGHLQLAHGGYWLVSSDTGYKYPVRDGIPVMLVEEGARWQDTPVDDLPVPPPPASEPAPDTLRTAGAGPAAVSNDPDYRILIVAGAILLALLLIIGLGRKRPTGGRELPPTE
ncbi:MAG: hypothetical protein KBF17_02700 [Candidatus Promineofilum sp.]|nr:hypothetical protein [Promineifilum sp.]MBP9657959.1 hypothetical protein [Promineifilum sp.]